MKGGQRKMEVYTVSCHGGQLKAHRRAGAQTHPLLIPQLLSSRLQPSIPSLVFISASVMRTKESTHSFAPPCIVSWSLQARLAGLISNCDLTAWWKDWHTRTNTHRSMYTYTHMWQREWRGPVLLGLINPWAWPQDKGGAGEEERVLPFLMSAIACRIHTNTHTHTHTHTDTWESVSVWRLKDWAIFLSWSLRFFPPTQHVNMTKPRGEERRGEERRGEERM